MTRATTFDYTGTRVLVTGCSRVPVTVTVAPASRNAHAVACPIPLEPPVTRTRVPV